MVDQDRVYLWSYKCTVISAKTKLPEAVRPQVISPGALGGSLSVLFPDTGLADQPRYLLKPTSPLKDVFLSPLVNLSPTPLEQIQSQPLPCGHPACSGSSSVQGVLSPQS